VARVDPGAVLDARGGPVILDEGAVVEPLSHVVGPAYIGRGAQVLGGKLSGVALGPQCRVGGEVELTVFQGYSNKRHTGFLGHSAVGEWVNLGAMTTNSDLKNNYGPVRVWVGGIDSETGETKIGCFIGDHVKTGIGTLLATGSVIGPGSNLFAGGRFTPHYLPGWSWWDGASTVPHRWDKFLATVRTAMSRRGRTTTAAYEAALYAAWKRGPKAL
jgi:UDP-N-acetylglucosamine diphosphorylase/glucosamine-1-phosphate N-acetyltransferase